jgi:hypothetical protein
MRWINIEARKAIWNFINPLQTNIALYKSLSELVTAKLEAPQLSIRAAKKWGILNLSNSFHYNQIKELGKLFIMGLISLEDFLSYLSSNTKVCDATYLKREGKKVYGAKLIKNYVVGCYELLQDVLFTVERYKGLNFIVDFRIVNHNKRHLTKPQEIAKAIKTGKIKKGIGLSSTGV